MKIGFGRKVRIDDIKVKNKLILLYIFSVLIPVIVTNLIFYSNISSSEKAQEKDLLSGTLKRVEINVTNSLDACIDITETLAKDDRLNILLDKNYKNSNDYLETYSSELKGYFDRYQLLYKKQIYEMNFYVTNPSIIDGDGFYNLNDTVKNSIWYKDAFSSDNNLIIDAYMDENADHTSSQNSIRYFSIVRKLDYFIYGSVTEKIMKIDIDYSFINKIIEEEGMKADIFIVNDKNNIVFSNNPDYSSYAQRYVSFDKYKHNPGTIMLSENMKDIFSGYKAIIVAPKSSVMNKIKSSNSYLIFLIIINLVLPSIIILLISKSFNNRLEMLSRHMKNIKYEKFNLVKCQEGKDEIGELINEFNRMATYMDKLIEDGYKASIQQKNLEIAKKQAELNALQSQINPHFLFNTLETIRMRSLLKEERETAQVIKYLSKMLRRALNWGNNLVPIYDEIAFTEDFLKIQVYRFGNKLKYSINVDDAVKGYTIPKLSIMTLVENACIHGIENISRAGSVEVSVKAFENTIKIIVKDDGIGMCEEKTNSLINTLINNHSRELDNSSKSVGLKNVYMRLEMCYGEKFSFSIKSKEDQGTEIEIIIPKEAGDG